MPTNNSTTITIRGKDETGKAFANVKRGLGTLPPAAGKATQGIGTAFDALKPKLGKFGTVLDGIKSALSGPAGLAVAAGSVVSGVSAFTAAVINNNRELQVTAERTGYTATQIKLMNDAAVAVGEDVGTVEGLLETFNERIQEAAEGTGEGAEVFELLGINIRNTDGDIKSSQSLLSEYAQTVNGMSDQTNAAAFNTRLLGGDGIKLISAFKGVEAQLDSTNTVFDDQAKASREAAKQWNALRLQVRNLLNGAVQPLIPVISNLLRALNDGTQTLRATLVPVWGSLSNAFQEVGRVALIVANHVGQNLFGVFQSVGGFLRSTFSPVIEGIQNAFRGLGGDMPRLGGLLRGLGAFFVLVSGRITELTQRVIGGAAALAKFGQAIVAVGTGNFSGAVEAARGIGEAWQTAAEQADATRLRTDKAVDSIRNAVTETVSWGGATNTVRITTGDIGKEFDGVTTNTKKSKEEVKRIKEEAEKAKMEMKAIGEAELARFQQYKANADNTRIIDQNNHNNRIEQANELHIKRLGYIDLERAAIINADIDSFGRRAAAIEQQQEIEDKQHENYVDNIRKQNEEAKKHEGIWKDIEKTLKTNVQEGIAGLIRGTTTFGNILSNIANNILNTIINKFAELATSAIFKAFSGGGNFFSNILSGLNQVIGRANKASAAVAAAGAASAGKAAGATGAGASAAGGASGVGAGIGKALGVVGKVAAIAAPIAAFGFLGRDRESETDRANKRIRESGVITDGTESLTDQQRKDLSRSVFNKKRSLTAGSKRKETLQKAGLYDEYSAVRRGGGRILERKRDAERAAILERAAKKVLEKDRTYDKLTDDQKKAIGLQFGGIVPARRGGTLALIGEGRKNEAVVPLPNGRAIPVEVKGGGMGTTINVNVNVEGGGSTDGLEQRIEEVLLRQTQTGGVLSGVF